MIAYFAALGLLAVIVLGGDKYAAELRRAWRYVQPYRGRYERPARRSYEPRHRDRSRLGVPQGMPALIRSEL